MGRAAGARWDRSLLSPPVVIVQGDTLSSSRLATVVCVPQTSNLIWADAPGNELLATKATGLSKSSVARASQIINSERALLVERAGRLASKQFSQILHGIDIVFGR